MIQSVGEGWVCECKGEGEVLQRTEPRAVQLFPLPSGCRPFSSPTSRPILGPFPNHRLIHGSNKIFSVCSSNNPPGPPPVQKRGVKASLDVLGQENKEFPANQGQCWVLETEKREWEMSVWVRSHLMALWKEKVMMNSCLLSEKFFLRLVVESRANCV